MAIGKSRQYRDRRFSSLAVARSFAYPLTERLNLLPRAPLLHLDRHTHWTFMAHAIPFSRNTNAARARRAKVMLLPISRQVADELALRAHLSLDNLHRGVGGITDAQALTQIMLLTGFLAGSGFGSVAAEQLERAERVASVIFDIGRSTGEWQLDSNGFPLFAEIVMSYDDQLHGAPLWAITDASEKLDRFTAGMQPQVPMRKRA